MTEPPNLPVQSFVVDPSHANPSAHKYLAFLDPQSLVGSSEHLHPTIPREQLKELKSELEGLLSTTNSRIIDLQANCDCLDAWIKSQPLETFETFETFEETVIVQEKEKPKLKHKLNDDIHVVKKQRLSEESLDTVKIVKLPAPSMALTESVSSAPSRAGSLPPIPIRIIASKQDKAKRRQTEDLTYGLEPDTTIVYDGDYTKAKVPPHQTPIAQFWNHCEHYFRNITMADLAHLEPMKNDPAFVVPPLGTHYRKQWAEEDSKLVTLFDDGAAEYVESEDTVYPGSVKMGLLSSRLLGSLCPEEVAEGQSPSMMIEDSPLAMIPSRSRKDMESIDDRLKTELKHLGLFEDEVPQETGQVEDDEITLELKRVQDELTSQMSYNQSRKDLLHSIAEKHIAYQEYSTLLDEINKAVEASYTRRNKNALKSKNKKLKILEHGHGPLSESLSLGLQARNKLIRDVGVYFPSSKFKIPTENVFED